MKPSITYNKKLKIKELEKRTTVKPNKTCLNCNFDYNGTVCPKCGRRKFKFKSMTFMQKLAVIIFSSNCSSCHKGRMSRDLTGWGKKAECTNCHIVKDVDWY